MPGSRRTFLSRNSGEAINWLENSMHLSARLFASRASLSRGRSKVMRAAPTFVRSEFEGRQLSKTFRFSYALISRTGARNRPWEASPFRSSKGVRPTQWKVMRAGATRAYLEPPMRKQGLPSRPRAVTSKRSLSFTKPRSLSHCDSRRPIFKVAAHSCRAPRHPRSPVGHGG